MALGVRWTNEAFIERATEVHQGRYLYDKVDIGSNGKFALIGCREHGYFRQNYLSHLNGIGCRFCGYLRCNSYKTLSRDEVIKSFHEVHGDRYDYSKFEYTKSRDKSLIICREHGEFLQTPHMHKYGSGCPKCWGFITRSEYIKRFSKTGSNLYLMRIRGDGEDFVKVGRAVKVFGRRRQIEKASNYEVEVVCSIHASPEVVWDTEVALHRKFKSFRYNPKINFGGSTECYDLKVLEDCLSALSNIRSF